MKSKLLFLIGIEYRKVAENFYYYPDVFKDDSKIKLYAGTWQSEYYFSTSRENIKKVFIFKQKLICDEISNSFSVSIHIRRGDYLSSKFASGFAKICTLDYYQKAISFIKKNKLACILYFFSRYQWV